MSKLKVLQIVLTAVTALSASASVAAAAPAPDPGELRQGTFPGGYRFLRYVPESLSTTKGAPLFVMLHGCTTTAEEQMAANQINQLAERKRFVVLYPDGDPSVRLLQCWRFTAAGGFPADQTRTSADPAAIAGMTRQAVKNLRLDARRVYLAGMSSGAAMTAILGATYPDLFAAIAMNAGCAYRAGNCVGEQPFRPSATLGREAYRAMGKRARIMPVLVMQGDSDEAIPSTHAAQVVEQWRVTDGLAATHLGVRPFGLHLASIKTTQAPGRYPAVVRRYQDRAKCQLIERWTFKGMRHFWPGGSSDPAVARFTDPKAPSGAEIAWKFFTRYRLTPRAEPCA